MERMMMMHHGPHVGGHRHGGRPPFLPWPIRMAMAAHHGRGRHRHGPPFGPFGGPGQFFRRPHRAGRGDVRAALLSLLAEQPLHGYQIIQLIVERSGGAWTPSPGSVYPMLQQLADEGLVQAEEADGRRVFHLTDTGQAYVAAHQEELAEVWAAMRGDDDEEMHEIGQLVMQVGAAFVQVMRAGNRAQIAEAKQLLTNVRRQLYRILADDEAPDSTATGETIERL